LGFADFSFPKEKTASTKQPKKTRKATIDLRLNLLLLIVVVFILL
jgi:hypothetical protein